MGILQLPLNTMLLPINTPQTACPIAQAVSFLLTQTGSRSLVLAFSGGMDSTVLLHELAKQKANLIAVHIHHGLQAIADDWLVHCQAQAQARSIPFYGVRVQVADTKRRGLEDRAREARYAALWQQVALDGVLLTAHHQRDQAETFLLRALRGAGVAGLGGIKSWQNRDAGRSLVRPLLSVSYRQMQDYANKEGLSWIEDPTNNDGFALRNRVRHEVLPMMTSLAQQSESQLAMAAQHSQEASVLLQLVGQEDWLKCRLNDFSWDVFMWRAMPWLRAKNALMTVWQSQAGVSLSVAQWQQVEQQFYDVGRDDAHPRFCYQGWCLLIDGAKGYFLPESAMLVPNAIVNWQFSGTEQQAWGKLASLVGNNALTHRGLTIKSRQGGETIKTTQGMKTLKKWLQMQGFPAWQKEMWPVVYDAQTNALLGWANMPEDWWTDKIVRVRVKWRLSDHQE